MCNSPSGRFGRGATAQYEISKCYNNIIIIKSHFLPVTPHLCNIRFNTRTITPCAKHCKQRNRYSDRNFKVVERSRNGWNIGTQRQSQYFSTTFYHVMCYIYSLVPLMIWFSWSQVYFLCWTNTFIKWHRKHLASRYPLNIICTNNISFAITNWLIHQWTCGSMESKNYFTLTNKRCGQTTMWQRRFTFIVLVSAELCLPLR